MFEESYLGDIGYWREKSDERTPLDPKEVPYKPLRCQDSEIRYVLDCGIQSDKLNVVLVGKDVSKGEGNESVRYFDWYSRVDSSKKSYIASVFKNRKFQGDLGSTTLLSLDQECAIHDILVVGIGHADKATTYDFAKAGRAIGDAISHMDVSGIAIHVDRYVENIACGSVSTSVSPIGFGQNIVKKPSDMIKSYEVFLYNMLFQMTDDDRFKTKKSSYQKIPALDILLTEDFKNVKDTKAYDKVIHIARGMNVAAQVSSAPANYCNPYTLTKFAKVLCEDNGMTCKVLRVKEMAELGMGSAIAVCKGSIYEPALIHMQYKPKNSKGTLRRIGYVGKAVCFDSGGYNLKSQASRIQDMKLDMSGAGALLGAAEALARMKQDNVEVDFIFIAVENMIGSRAYRPGDIVTASNGVTIEVGNTDAEGRLTLADALIYAKNQKYDCIVDMATLTGACLVALGHDIAGAYANCEKMSTMWNKSACCAGEYMWPLPLVEHYTKLLDSYYADIGNLDLGGRGGGSIVAAMFLHQFVKDTPWVHVDLAGPVFNSTNRTSTGFGVASLVSFACDASTA